MKIGVYGLGRFGYFWSQLLSEKYSVAAYNRSLEKPCPETVRRVSLEDIVQTDVLFLCVSISAFSGVIEELGPLLRPGALVIDTCSVKSYPQSVMERWLPLEVNYLATHPMFGPDSAKNGAVGLPLVFCSGRLPLEAEQFWLAAFESFGLRVIRMSAEEHDREAAFTQGVTHFIGRVLDKLDLRESAIATVGYRRLLEIIEQTCNDPLQLFYDLQRYNPFTHDMRLQLKSSIESTMELLARADQSSVK